MHSVGPVVVNQYKGQFIGRIAVQHVGPSQGKRSEVWVGHSNPIRFSAMAVGTKLTVMLHQPIAQVMG